MRHNFNAKYLIVSLLILLLSTGLSWAQEFEGMGIMHLDVNEVDQDALDYEYLPRAPIIQDEDFTSRLASSYSLLSYLEYTPSERNQGSCGNCWLWASTGIAGIALNVQNGCKERLSIQYCSSCNTAKSCCDGGGASSFADFYSDKGFILPWSNTNAEWQNGDGTCHGTCASISTSPQYTINSVSALTIETHDIAQETAISNIKNVLSQKKGVYMSFRLPTTADWNTFRSMWSSQAESTTIDLDFAAGKNTDAGYGGHGVLIVGYDESDANNKYWIVLNSWGTTASRSNGLFRVDMDMDYDTLYNPSSLSPTTAFNFFTLDMEYGGEPCSGSYTYYIPYFIKSSKGAWTGVALRNLSTSYSANVTVTCYSTSGSTVQTLDKTIEPRGHQSFLVGVSFDKLGTSGWVKVTSDQELRGLSFFSQDGTLMADMDMIYSKKLSSDLVAPHFDQGDEWDTTIFLFNPGSFFSSSVTLTAVNDDGTVLGTKTYSLGAKCSAQYPVSDLIKSNAVGSVEIKSRWGKLNSSIGGFALFSNTKTGKSNFAGLSTPSMDTEVE